MLINQIANQQDGKILAAGPIGTWDDPLGALLRFRPDGSLDSSFGAAGILDGHWLQRCVARRRDPAGRANSRGRGRSARTIRTLKLHVLGWACTATVRSPDARTRLLWDKNRARRVPSAPFRRPRSPSAITTSASPRKASASRRWSRSSPGPRTMNAWEEHEGD
ncbi:MAG: delta-60 repeat domain-containing protein [Planctomycetota bacterium]